MRFHCLGVQHTITNKEYIACAFTQKVLKFCEMMTDLGHTVFHYGNEGADLRCTENIAVLSREEFDYKSHDHHSKLFTYDISGPVYKTFNARAIVEIGKRKQTGDFLLAFWGVGHQPICDAHPDMIVVEPGIGYGDMFAKYKVFESYAIYHAYHNIKHVKECFVLDDEFENDAIIPNYYNISEFETDEKDDYFLFVGRVGLAKGLGRAIKMTKAVGARLVVAGQNAETGFREEGFWPIPDHVEYVGYIGVEQRKRLMARAKAVVCFSRFIEPFCGVHVEAMLSGTPVITCDWGAMTEFNVHGVTGFRCRTLDEMIEAARNIHTINPAKCREWAMSNFSVEVIGPKYERYFERILKKEMTLDYDRIQQEEQPFADRLGPCLKRLLNPKKFLDIGCGPGMHVRVMDSLGVDSLGVELDTRATHPLIKNQSLLELHGKYTADLVMSLEVAEHIDAQYVDSIVQNMVESIEPGGTLVWTAAHPGQGGIGHINCQPKEYWVEKFTAQGLIRDETLENEIKQEMLQGYHMGWFIMNLLVFRKNACKTAIWTDTTWAMGRIATSISKTIPGGADIYDFRTTPIVPILERYSRVIAKSDVFYVDIPEHLKKKLVVTFHCPTFTDEYFREHFVYWPGVTYTGVSQETCDELRRHGVPAPIWTPYGADLDIFKNTHVIDGPIKRIGITGGYHPHVSSQYIEVKGLRLFEELCSRVGAEPVFLLDRTDAEIYKDIDLLVCCSKFEAGPLGIFEAAACGVPVLTRPVGNAQLIDGIALFDTIDEAVIQIQSWNQLPRSLYTYTKHITREVREQWSMQKLLTGIPRVIFQTAKTSQPDYVVRMIQEVCPNYAYKFFSDEDILRFFNENPLPEFPNIIECFSKLENGAHKADLFRYYYLYVNGGVFMDSDLMVNTSFENIRRDYDMFTSESCMPGSIFQGILGCTSGNKLMLEAIRNIYTADPGDLAKFHHWTTFDLYKIMKKPHSYKVKYYQEVDHYETVDSVDPDTGKAIFTHYHRNKVIPPPVLDFIEIGAGDFCTEIEKSVGTQLRGITVEPIKDYFEALPNTVRVKKVRAAISNFSGSIDIFSLRNPEKYGMPDWVRGCNSVGSHHPQVMKLVRNANLNEQEVFTVEHVPVMTFTELVKGYNSCKYLKIDTEGHDYIVLGSYLDCVDAGKFELVPRILFEANELTTLENIETILTRLATYGYTVESRDQYDIIVVRSIQDVPMTN
jgi:glycosyltransferase involved in cell wall biosynthesis/SAM-dependent methyltransferase